MLNAGYSANENLMEVLTCTKMQADGKGGVNMNTGQRAAYDHSIMLWILIFGCKFTESYFFLTLSFCDPISVMVGMKIQGCND
ncbi:hypothetical protein JB92DRAFT_3288040 [Gautieria morchelliformis]|nr:hypothetical protein JB92DRAFT_3288040 [Gautieria morchelliformis]